MEHEMKLSPATVRRLRSARGWSQQHLAEAAGLSPRTIQRVEGQGIASMATAVSLAATFDMPLLELQHAPAGASFPRSEPGQAGLFLGVAVISLAILLRGARPFAQALGPMFDAIDLLLGVVGVLVAAPALVRLVRRRVILGAALAVLGTPWATLLAAGAWLALAGGHAPSWPLVGMGTAGMALAILAARECSRTRQVAES